MRDESAGKEASTYLRRGLYVNCRAHTLLSEGLSSTAEVFLCWWWTCSGLL